MLKTILVLPDGSEISSGKGQKNAIKTATLEECVNDAEDLTFGAVCAKTLDVDIITPSNELVCQAKNEIVLYKEDENANRHKIGHFITEKPTKVNANCTRITAYDRIVLLDKDLTEWLKSLQEFPYTLYSFAQMVCEECGLTLANESIPNGDTDVYEFTADGITGRQLMQWIGQAAGSFCIANADGEIEFSWYAQNATPILPRQEDGAVTFLGGGLKYEDYVVSAVQRVQIRQDSDDVGTVYPTEGESDNTYIIEENPLLSALDAQTLLPVAEKLYLRLQEVAYTPCSVTVPASLLYNVGDIISITDRNGAKFIAYVMTKSQSGQTETLECTGNFKRNGASTLYNASYKSLVGKTLAIKADVDGLKVASEDTNKSVAALELSAKSISTRVEDAEGDISELQQTAGMVQLTVKSDSGTLTTAITSKAWEAIYKNISGETQSGFYFDFTLGRFVYDGTGVFRSEDGKTYIELEGNELVLYSSKGTSTGDAVDKLRIGFISGTSPDGSTAVDYPYMLLGNSGSTVGMIKEFYNGLWLGNSVPKTASGNFEGMEGAAGFFINTRTGVVYVVNGTDMQNVYTGAAVAKFA